MSDDTAASEHAVVDRIEGDRAVLLVGDAETEALVSTAALPAGAGEGAWLRVRRDASGISIIGHDPDGEARQRERMRRRTDRLRRERGGGRFSR